MNYYRKEQKSREQWAHAMIAFGLGILLVVGLSFVTQFDPFGPGMLLVVPHPIQHQFGDISTNNEATSPIRSVPPAPHPPRSIRDIMDLDDGVITEDDSQRKQQVELPSPARQYKDSIIQTAVVEDETSFTEQERNAREQKRRFHRHVHALSTSWAPVRLRFITPNAPADPNQVIGAQEDPEACSYAGQVIAVGADAPADDKSIQCDEDTPIDCWTTCNETHIKTNKRASMLGVALQRVGSMIESALTVQPSGTTASFDQVKCGRYNVSGFFVGNAYAVVTTRPEFSPLMYSVTTTPCLTDAATQRPFLFHINIAPILADNSTTADHVVLRGMMHAMGLNYDSMASWLYPDTSTRYRDTDPSKFPTGPINGTDITIFNGSITVGLPRVAGDNVKYMGPMALAAAKAHLDCHTMDHVPLEDAGTSTLLFFEKRIFRGDVLTRENPLSVSPLSFSAISLGAMLDTGWYDRNKGEFSATTDGESMLDVPLPWGRGAGCNFVNISCSEGGWAPNYFCTNKDGKPACGFDRTFSGSCNYKFLGFNLPDVYRIHNTSLAMGGTDEFTDRCPFVEPYTPSTNNRGFCTVSQTIDPDTTPPTGYRVGQDSRCFSTTVTNKTSPNAHSDDPAVRATLTSCHQVVCVGTILDTYKTVMTRVGDVFLPCLDDRNFTFIKARSGVTGTAPHLVESPTFDGALECGRNLQSLCGTRGVAKRSYWPTINGITPNKGPLNGGTLVTITGKNLAHCTAMRIGSVYTTEVNYNYRLSALEATTAFISDREDSVEGSPAIDGLGLTDVEIFCVLKDICDEGCFAARLKKGFNLTRLEPCNGTLDARNCRTMPICDWNGTHCIDRVFTPAPTPEPVVTDAPDTFVDPRCHLQAPVFCDATHRCAPTPDLCLVCSEPMVQCWNSECRRSLRDCDCVPDHPVRCDSGICVEAEDDCEACDSTTPFKCFDGSCAKDADSCARCPREAPYRCNATTNYCVGRAEECSKPNNQQCALDRCLSTKGNTCQANDGCACPQGSSVRCWNGKCAASQIQCDCDSLQPYRCDGGACALSVNFCNASRTPCGLSEFRCSNEACQANQQECLCSIKEAPSIRILATPQLVRYNDWVRIVSEARLDPCGIDRSADVSYSWTLDEVDNGAGTTTPVPIRSELLKGSTLQIPPYALSPNKNYHAKVNATAFTLSATAEITMKSTSPEPTIAILGGNRDVPSSATLELDAVVDDPAFKAGVVKWTCCVANAANEACIDSSKCPPLFDAVSDLHTLRVTVSSGTTLPLGNFFFAAIYQSSSSSVLISVKDEEVPQCQLILQPQITPLEAIPAVTFVNEEVTIHSEITFDGATATKWSLNGTIYASASDAKLVLPPNTLPAGFVTVVGLTVTTNTDQISRCFITIKPDAPPLIGRCFVSNNAVDEADDYQTNLGTAGKSLMKMSTVGWGSLGGSQIDQSNPFFEPRSSPLYYRYGYLDAVGRQILLTADFLPVPTVEFVAPLMLRNPSLISVRFFVEVAVVITRQLDPAEPQRGSSTNILEVRNTTCTADIKSYSDRTTPSLVEDAYAMVKRAVAKKNLVEFLKRGAKLASVLQDTDILAARVSTISREMVDDLYYLLSSPVALNAPSAGGEAAANSSSFRGQPFTPSLRSLALDMLDMLAPLLDKTVKLVSPTLKQTPALVATNLQDTYPARWEFPTTVSITDGDMVLRCLEIIVARRDGENFQVKRDIGRAESLMSWSHLGSNSTFAYLSLSKLVVSVLPQSSSHYYASSFAATRSSTANELRFPLFPGTTLDNQAFKARMTHATPTQFRTNRAWSTLVGMQPDGSTALPGSDASTQVYPEVIFPTEAITLPTVSPLEHIFVQIFSLENMLPSADVVGLQDLPKYEGAELVDRGNLTVVDLLTLDGVNPDDVVAHYVAPVSAIAGIDVRIGARELANAKLHVEHSSTPRRPIPPTLDATEPPNSLGEDDPGDGLPGSEDAIPPQQLLEEQLERTPAKVRFAASVENTRHWYASGVNTPIQSRNLTCYRYDVGHRRWIPRGRAVIAGEVSSDSLQAIVECNADRFGFYGVFDRAQYPIATPAPTPQPEIDLGADVIALAKSLSGLAIAAIVLGCVVFVAGVGYLIYLRRERMISKSTEAANAEQSEMLVVSELLQTDKDLRQALEISRIRMLYGEDL